MTTSASSLSEDNAQNTSSVLPAIETLVDPERLACAQKLEAHAAVSNSEAARSAADDAWMDLALAQARKAWRISPPNPSVGAVIVRNGRLVGAGHTQRTGGPHAEVMALRSAFERGLSVEGATVYVTLEPCIMAVLRLALLHSFNPKSDVWWPPSEIRILKYTAAAFVCSLKLEFRLSLVSEKQRPERSILLF